jgi:small subunit ribosomal protein S9
MTDDEQNKETSEQADGAPVEGSEDSTAGPAAGEGTSPSQATGDEPVPTPPAEETVEATAEDDAAQEPEAEKAEEAPAEKAEEAPAEKAEEAPAEKAEPKAEEKKKDVIPGADLEPIAVEPVERPLSAEEQARRDAEKEERAKREAELAGEAEEAEPSAASRAPAKLDGDARFLATGKRKTSIARVTLLPGSGKIQVNERALEEFFPRPLHQTMARQPLTITGYEGSVDVRVRVHGGGISGQAGAVRHGIARALTEVDPDLRGELKRRGFLTRDARAKERRKAGLKKARKRPQFSKR